MRLVVGVAQLVRNRIEKEVAALRVKVRGELLVNLHVRRVRESGRGCVRRLHRGDSVRAHVQHERGDDARLVRAVGVLHVAAQLAQKRVRAVVRQKRVELVEEAVARERVRKRREDAWRLRNLGEEIHLEVWREGVWQPHVAREGGENEVSHLDARRRDGVAEEEVVVAQKLWKVVEQHEEHAQRAAVEHAHGRRELGGGEKRLQKGKEAVDKELLQQRPALVPLEQEELGHEHAVRNELEPGKREARKARRLERVERRAKRVENLRLDGVEGRVRRVEVEEPRAKEAQVGALVEGVRTLLVLHGLVLPDEMVDRDGEDAREQLQLDLGPRAVGRFGRDALDEEEDELRKGVERGEGDGGLGGGVGGGGVRGGRQRRVARDAQKVLAALVVAHPAVLVQRVEVGGVGLVRLVLLLVDAEPLEPQREHLLPGAQPCSIQLAVDGWRRVLRTLRRGGPRLRTRGQHSAHVVEEALRPFCRRPLLRELGEHLQHVGAVCGRNHRLVDEAAAH
mmetsp:Transcript_25719/g.56384  ORF Transcript_25719/g.56384 Transcript_25719/m.56384 type:complete len:509 (-) Transcript_25719:836-2362(-)